MDTVKVLLEAIPSVGFPIVIAIAMAVFIYKIYKASEKREENLINELKETRKINAQAIETIAQYATDLGTIKDNITEIKTDIIKLTAKVEEKI